MPDENAVQGLDEFQKSIVEGQIGAMILGPLPPEDSPLRPLGEARALARGCIDAARGLQTHLEVSKLRGIAPNDRWWIQMSLLTTHTTASKLMRLLADGVRDVILLTYSRNSPLRTAGITRSNAHDLIATLMLETVRKAWGVIYDREEYGRDEMHPIKQGSKGLTLSTLLTFDKPLVAMIEGQSGPFPLFRDEHLFAVLNAISESLKWDQDNLNARLQWEYVHAARLIDENKQLGENLKANEESDETQKAQQAAAALTKRFAVGLSFPGEHRDYVRSVAEYLSEIYGKDHVLYDHYHEEEFAQPNLDTYLPDLYERECDLNVVFLCKEYDGKTWCKLEWRAIRQLITSTERERLMLVRMDDAKVEGSCPGDGYIDATKHDPEQVGKQIIKRLIRLSKGTGI